MKRARYGRFYRVFWGLEDPRESNARHPLLEMLMIGLCTMLCGGEDCSDMALFGRSKEKFLRQFLSLPHGIPSHDTFSRLFRLLDPHKFHDCFLSFMQHFARATQGVIAIDGKTLRGSFDKASGASPLHLISAWAADQRLVLGQLAVDRKSNEITAVPKLLEMLALKGTIVTVDALNCQRTIARQIVDQGGDYALALKGNQTTLFADVILFMEDPQREPDPTYSTVEANHGRIETRIHSVCPDIAWLQEQHKWPGLTALGRVVRQRVTDSGTSCETAYYLLSTALTPQRLGEVIRSHWGIENTLHWVLDVTMNEDHTRNRKDHGPQNIALLRKLALNIARTEPSKGSMKGKFKKAGWDDAFLKKLLTQKKTHQMR